MLSLRKLDKRYRQIDIQLNIITENWKKAKYEKDRMLGRDGSGYNFTSKKSLTKDIFKYDPEMQKAADISVLFFPRQC